MAIRTGDIRRYRLIHTRVYCILVLFILYFRGVSIVQSTSSKALMKECAAILESMKVPAN